MPRYSVQFKVSGYPKQTFTGETFAEVSAAWEAFRDSGGFGSSAVKSGGTVKDHVPGFKPKAVANMSYNGRIWSSRDAWQTERPLYDPSAC